MMTDTALNILYEDDCIIVCRKPRGVPTQSKNPGVQDMESLLKNHLAAASRAGSASSSRPYLAIIHRLDQPVEGILVFAKTPSAARDLNRQLQNHGFVKCYHALVDGIPPDLEGGLEDYLIKDTRTNTSRVCPPGTPGAKPARLHYRVVQKGQGLFNWGQGDSNWGRGKSQKTTSPTELEILLDTGRHHQIRVQLANLGCPIVGDTKYNAHCQGSDEWQELKLCACKLSFCHPKTHKRMTFSL